VASRAEPLPARAGGGLRSAFRAAAIDFYYQSIRVVPANIAWGVAFLAVLAIAISGGPIVTLLGLPLLAIPYVGIVRLAALTARGRDVVLSDVWRAYREFGLAALAIGVLTTLAAALLASNVVIGATMGGLGGWLFATLAASGLLGIWVVGFPLWILLVDPERADRRLRDRVRLAVLLVLAAPGRMLALGLLLLVLLLISTVAFAALLTISLSYAALVAARYVLPLADRLETWLAAREAGRAQE
jgi:uncharacterized membrane protein YesL